MTDNEIGPFTRLQNAAKAWLDDRDDYFVSLGATLNDEVEADPLLHELRDALAAVEGFKEWGNERSEGPYMNVPGGFRNQRSRWLEEPT